MRYLFLGLCLFASSLSCASPEPPEPGIRPARIEFTQTADGGEVVDVLGIGPGRLKELRSRELTDDEWHEVFAVYSGSYSPPPDQPPMLGRYEVLEDRLRFVPRFSLVPGFRYLARYQDAEGHSVSGHYQVTEAEALEPTTEVLGLYPSGEEVPENLLRVYLRFSAPMGEGEARWRVRLEDGAGGELPLPFVASETELWTPDRDRLTLFLDPGRIKRKVGPNLEMGPPLKEGSEVRLVVDGSWPDAQGTPLVAGFEKRFRIGPPDRTAPRPETWGIVSPKTGTSPLRLSFPEPLDHALASRLIQVFDQRDQPVEGVVTLAPGEVAWALQPAEPWKPGAYRIRIDPALEDPCGNSLRGTFETRVGDQPGAGRGAEPVFLSFEVEAH